MLVVWSVLGLTARAAWAGPQYDRALAAYERVEYPETVRFIERALPTEALSLAELERAYYLLGSALLGDGQAARAERAFQTLAALRPGYQPERDASPKVIESIRRARATVGATAPSIRHDPVMHPGSTGELEVAADIIGAAVLEAAVEYRLVGESRALDRIPARVKLRCTGTRCQAMLPAATESYRLGFLTAEGAFALGTGDYRVAPAATTETGSADRGAKKPPLYKRWWLWTAVGVVVVGAVVGTTVGVTLTRSAARSIEFTITKDCGGAAVCPLWSTP